MMVGTTIVDKKIVLPMDKCRQKYIGKLMKKVKKMQWGENICRRKNNRKKLKFRKLLMQLNLMGCILQD